MARIKHGTLSAATPATVTLDADYDQVEILNRDSALEIYYRVDGTTPTVAGDDCYPVLPGQGLLVSVPTAGATQVQLISSGTAKYSVTGVL